MAPVWYFWHVFIHRAITFTYLQYSRPPPIFITLCQMFGRRHTPSVCPSLFMFHIDCPISTNKFISCFVLGPSQWFVHFVEEIVIARTQEKTTTLGDTEPYHSMTMQGATPLLSRTSCASGNGRSGTSIVLTRHESLLLRSLRQSERITASDPVQHERWTYPCCRAVNSKLQEKWTRDGVRHLPNIWAKGENYMPSDLVRFGLWLWERTACRCKNIDLRIWNEVVWTGL